MKDKIKRDILSKKLEKNLKYNYLILNTKGEINKNINGMYTIEMSILFPIMLFIVFGGIYIAFFAHDITVARAECDKCCNEAAGHGLAETDIENRIENSVSKHLILGKVKEIKVSKKRGYINVSINLSYDLMFWKLKKTETIKIVVNEVNNPDYLRKVQVITDELKKMIR
ncbi:MAG: pilus assembly protein [Lachnospiraceae bacterium]|nr:pilus assembly protein [Lachnospiraceae bacterium]